MVMLVAAELELIGAVVWATSLISLVDYLK